MNNDSTNEQKFLENYKKRIIKDLIKNLCKDYTIYDTDDNLIDSDVLYKRILTPKTVKRCIGVTNTNPVSQCSRNAIDNYDYCKTHLYKMCLQSNEDEDVLSSLTNIEYLSMPQVENDYKNLKKKFIDDSFYYIDEKYIYDSSYSKVGYIQNNNYILTNDPFILETI